MFRCITTLFFLLAGFYSFAQSIEPHATMVKAGKGSLYGGIGFHRVYYTKSDIHFADSKTANYNFTLKNVRAVDDKHLQLGKGVDAPQYSLRLGYFFNNEAGIGIEFNFDHTKYIVVQNQKVRVQGQINGNKLDKDTTLGSDFIEYEHTDGANYYMLNFVKQQNLLRSKNKKYLLGVVVKPGIGLVIPRTDSKIMGLQRHDRYNIAGFVLGLETGLRYQGGKYFFAETTFKGAYANYSNVLLFGQGRASQSWWSFQPIVIIGLQLPL